MTLARRDIVTGLALLAFAPPAWPATLTLTTKIVTDPLSGVAIFGFDPVVYFLEGRAGAGRSDIEAVWSGVAWRFASKANRAAFLRDPTVFAPAYGGYDAEAISRSAAVIPDPAIFLVEDARLFLFRSRQARDSFVSGTLRPSSDASWPAVLDDLKP
jgi:hypothetical protein